jgi:hypothetical protein
LSIDLGICLVLIQAFDTSLLVDAIVYVELADCPDEKNSIVVTALRPSRNGEWAVRYSRLSPDRCEEFCTDEDVV